MSLKLEEFSDRELLYLLTDVANHEGWSAAKDIAERISPGSPPERNVTVRLSWLKRYGVLDNEDHKPEEGPRFKRWRLTTAGDQFMRGRLTAGQVRALESLSEGSLLLATSRLASRLSDASPQAATMMGREWRHGAAQRQGRWAGRNGRSSR